MFDGFTYITIFGCFLGCALAVNFSARCSGGFQMGASSCSSSAGPSIPFGSFLGSCLALVSVASGRVDLPSVDPWVCLGLEARASEVSDCCTCRSVRCPSDYLLASAENPAVPWSLQGC